MEGRRVDHNLSRNPNKKRRLRVISLYVEEGLNCAQVAREIGISRQAVRQMLIRAGVEIRRNPHVGL